MTNSIKTPLEWQEWLKTKCQKHFPTFSLENSSNSLLWENGTETEPFIYGNFTDLEENIYLQKIGIEVGIVINSVTGETTFSVSLVPDYYNASDHDSYLILLSRGRTTIDEAMSEAKVTLTTLAYSLREICKSSK